MIKFHSKAKYRYFIIKEIRSTEITYLEQLTRMNCIKDQLYGYADPKVIFKNEIDALMPHTAELLATHHEF